METWFGSPDLLRFSGDQMEEFVSLQTADALARVRAIADDVWPKTFREILSPEQIIYMMKMMYAPEVMEKELTEG